jgi:hypothetical protein
MRCCKALCQQHCALSEGECCNCRSDAPSLQHPSLLPIQRIPSSAVEGARYFQSRQMIGDQCVCAVWCVTSSGLVELLLVMLQLTKISK